MKYDVFVLLCVVNKQLWRAQQALNAQCYKCQVMGVLACKCVHVREQKKDRTSEEREGRHRV